ncbi:MAG: type III secretion protein [Planctomycetota bacterium]|jgi:hypothetical protein|nr:type III secretion protein [Planctomycetota bacterium]
MAKYPLGALLSARKFREEAAAREERAAREKAELARKLAQEAQEECRRYREWRPGEEKRLFELVRGRDLPRCELDGHLNDVRELQEIEIRKDEAARQADREAEAARKLAEKAREKRIQAFRNRQKIEEHREIWQKRENRRLEAAGEAEAEDSFFPAAREEEVLEP